MKTKILMALFISALCTSKVLAWQYGNNGMPTGMTHTGYNAGTYGYQSPSIQPIGPCGNFGGGTAITTPTYGGGSTTFYSNGGTAITTPTYGGGSTTFYSGY